MNRLLTFVLAAALVSAPAVASADGFLSPFIGANFGGNTTEKTTVWGGAIGFVGQKAGFEFDVGYTSEFFAEEALGVDGKLVTMMGNVILGGGKRSGFSPYIVFGGGLIRTDISVIDDVLDVEASKNSWGGDVGVGFFAGGKTVKVRADVRYFRAFGGGLIRTNISVIDDVLDVEAAKNSLGGDVGVGFFAGGKTVKVRADVRYFRAFDFDDGLDLDLDLGIIDDTLGFWRGSVGIALMW